MTQDEKILEQVRSDIIIYQARLSNIQNEIADKIRLAEKALEEKYNAKSEQLEREYSKKKDEQAKQQKYLDDYMIRLDAKDSENLKKEESLSKRETDLKGNEDTFNIAKNKFNQILNDSENAYNKKLSILNEKERVQIEKDQAQDLREKNLNDKEASFEAISKNLDDKISEDKDILSKNEAILEAIKTEKTLVLEESKVIRENLDTMQKEKQSIIQLSAIKNDIQKFEEEKEKFSKEKAETLQLSKNVETRDKAVTERETTANEKDKYQAIRERQIQDKLDILKKIRSGENA
jgi:hypothetical protein